MTLATACADSDDDSAVEVIDVGAEVVTDRCSLEVCGPYRCHEVLETCRTACESAEHCRDGFVCEGGACLGTECEEGDAAGACAPYTCVRGFCATSCATSGCTADNYCHGEQFVCVPRCTSREDELCQGYLCDLAVGECEPYCHAGELDCAAGYVCSDRDTCEPAGD